MAAVDQGTIVVYGDIACPWATCAVARFTRVRAELGLEDAVRLDHRAFPLELVNEQPTPKLTLDAEIPVVGALEPSFGFQMWTAPEHTWPVSVLLPLEAVQAAKAQGLAASEALDLGLRRAMFCESRCIAVWSVVMDVARGIEDLDHDALAKALLAGDGRTAVVDQWQGAEEFGADGSPHFFLPDGTDHHNPGIEMHWEGEHGEGFPVVDSDDPAIYEDLLRRAT